MMQATNAIGAVLPDGKKDAIAKRRNIPGKGVFRNHLMFEEKGRAVAAEVMVAGRIEDEDLQGHVEFFTATVRAASFIKEAFERESADRLPEAC